MASASSQAAGQNIRPSGVERVPETRLLGTRTPMRCKRVDFRLIGRTQLSLHFCTIFCESIPLFDILQWQNRYIPKIRFWGTQNQRKNELKRQVEQDFSSLFAKFLPYMMIFQNGVH